MVKSIDEMVHTAHHLSFLIDVQLANHNGTHHLAIPIATIQVSSGQPVFQDFMQPLLRLTFFFFFCL